MKPVAIVFSVGVVGLLMWLVNRAGQADPPLAVPTPAADAEPIEQSVVKVNAWLRRHWADEGVDPAELADDLTVFRRLSLALHGTIPSLQEINAFRQDTGNDRIERWVVRMLEDDRFADYFAERLERVLVGVEEGTFVIFRRDRLRAWLSEQLQQDRPWPQIVTDLIASEGLWTSAAASNFVTAAHVDGEGLDENKLAGRTVRAFLGQRIDCAQCHDHPFDDWKQSDFEGLAAFYGQARVTPGGVIDRTKEDGRPVVYEVIDPGDEEGRLVEPQFPFHPEWASEDTHRRRQLASWIIHPENRRFERAIANRVWGLMFGRSWDDPVDDLGHPYDDEQERDLLDVLGGEFRTHAGSLKSLIRIIAQSDAFRLRSDVPGVDVETYSEMDFHGAVFPLVRLRPEQMIGSMFQAARVRTIDRNSNLFIRFARFTNENDFLKEYGDAEDDELLQQSGTIPQALLRMNGRFTRELTKTELLTTAGQVMRYSGDDETIVQNCFLACLTRLPTTEERLYFTQQLQDVASRQTQQDSDQTRVSPAISHPDDGEVENSTAEPDQQYTSRQQVVKDMFWLLYNSPGFSWNH